MGNTLAATGIATVLVSDPGSTVTSSTFGGVGNGSMTIQNGGVMSLPGVGGSFTIGSSSGPSPTVLVTGTGSALNIGSFGGVTSGSLTIQSAGVVTVGTSFGAGSNGGIAGAITVTGAGSQLNVGSFSGVESANATPSSIQILNGGVYTGTNMDVGLDTGNTGTMNVDGAGSKWIGSGFMRVGGSGGTGTLTIWNGATASGTILVIGGNGANTGGTGTMTITGAGSSWTGTAQVQVGNGGTGTLNVSNGATFTTALGSSMKSSGVIGLNSGTGTANISGGSTWNQDATLQVGVGTGGAGTGTLNITGGSVVNSASGVIGTNAGAVGTVLVSGTNSLWDNTATPNVNCVPCANKNLDIGLTGGGTGTLTVNSGGKVKANNINVGPNGTVKGNGGTLQGNVIVDGVVRPGNSPGVLNISGNFTLNSDGTLTLQVAGTTPGTQYSQLNITGTGTFNGLIDLAFINGFAPTQGQVFNFISYGSLGAGTPTFLVEGLQPGFQFTPVFGSSGFSIQALNTASPVPEPATLTLFAAGLAALGLRRRRGSSR